MVLLTKGFGNTLYRITFIFENRLDVDEIFGTPFMNRPVYSIMCREQKIQLGKGTGPIVGKLSPGSDGKNVSLYSAKWSAELSIPLPN